MPDPDMPKMPFDLVLVRLSAQASESRCKDAVITLDTDMAGKVRECGTLFNTLAPDIQLTGVPHRKIPSP